MLEDKNLEFLINLGTFKPKYIALRVFIISSIAAFIIYFVGFLVGENIYDREKQIFAYFITIAAFNSVSEGNLLALQFLGRNSWIRKNLYAQVLSIIAITLFLATFWVAITEEIFSEERLLDNRMAQVVLILGILIIVIHLLIIIISNLTKEWLSNRREIDNLKQAKLLSDYNLLKDRLNPHFLFNNLSVLKSLIHYNQKEAEIFTQNFTNVYRYVLKSHEEKLVSLEEELKFLESYIALHKERIGEGLFVDINIDKKYYTEKIPPLSLQLLVENAIKHNIANKLRPLQISIYIANEYIVVKNNLNKKETTYSTSTGLNTLKAQYQLIANQQISIIENETHYTVGLPII